MLCTLGGLPLLSQPAAPGSPEPPFDVRYDLRAGDRLVYKQVLERLSKDDVERQTRYEWRTQVLVLGRELGLSVVAIQRNRVAAELVRLGSLGGERLAQERRRFAASLPPLRFAETNFVDDRGGTGLPWSVLREIASEMLPGFHEIEPLPPRPVEVGDSWPRGGAVGLEERAAAVEDLAGRRCLRTESSRERLRLRTWFDLDAGLLARFEVDNQYEPEGRRVRERLTLEAVERVRGEDVAAWLTHPETQQATLAGLALQGSRPVSAATLYALADADDAAVSRGALSLAYRRNLAPRDTGPLDRALGSPDPRVRVLATRLAATLPESAAAPILARAGQDPVPAVREAASSASRRPRPSVGACSLPPSEARPELPGATLRAMTSPGFEGWPYVIYVPEDYRGDQAFPLLVYLTGGAGEAILGLTGAHAAIERSGYVVVLPQASQLWWSQRSVAIVSTLLDETLRRLRIDTDRVFVSGFSNGGAGAYLFAALFPDRFAAAVSLMGAGVQQTRDAVPAVNLHALPSLFVHGARDQVIPSRASQDTVGAIRKAAPRAPVELRILPGRGHDVILGADEGLALDFLAGRRRDPFPRRLRFAVRDLRFARAFWIEVLDKDSGTAALDAEIETDGTIRLRSQKIRRLRLLLRRELLTQPSSLRVVWNGEPSFAGPFVEDCGLLRRTAAAAADPQRAWSMELELSRPR